MATSKIPPIRGNRPQVPLSVVGPDGVSRSEAQDRKLNQLGAAVFASAAGQEFLDYLRSITLHAVAGPEVTDIALRHREGMRYLYAIIEARRDAGAKTGKVKRTKKNG